MKKVSELMIQTDLDLPSVNRGKWRLDPNFIFSGFVKLEVFENFFINWIEYGRSLELI